MSIAHAYETVPAHPLGIPVDGRKRYGMTPEQACLYRWLVKYRPHDQEFRISMRQVAKVMLCKSHENISDRVDNLIDRGWLKECEKGRYAFVHPVMHFKAPR